MDTRVRADEDRKTRYNRWLLAAWWLMIEDLGWGDSQKTPEPKRMGFLDWFRKIFKHRPRKVPFESQVKPLDAWSEAVLIGLINIERGKHGLKPVTIHPALTGVAMKWTATQAKINAGTYDHGDFATRIAEVVDAEAGEIGAVGNATMPGTVEAWMASPGHRAKILTADYVVAGASRAVASDMTTYTGCDFAAESTSWPKSQDKVMGMIR